MRILFVGRNCKVGGGCTFRYRASMGLISRGHEVSLLAQGGPMLPRFQELGVQFFRVPPTPFNRLRLISVMRRERLDLVHACNPTAGDDVSFARKFVNSKPAFVLSIHGNLPDDVKGNRCLREAAQLMTFDQSAVERLRDFRFLADGEIHLVPRPVECRAEMTGAISPPRIVLVSRLSKSKVKVAHAALQAVVALLKNYPGLSLTIVGGGTMLEDLRRRIEELNQRHGVKIAEAVGMLVDPFPVMAGATCVVGTSYVALEALFHEIPVVAAGYEGYGVVNLSNLQDAVDCNFGDGFPGICKNVTPEIFVEGFQQIFSKLASPEGRQEYRQIRERLQQRHSIPKVAEALERIYTLALERNAGGNG